MKVQETAVQTDRILTIPNVLSMIRLAGIPVFIWLALGPQLDQWAALLLAVAGLTDFLDGYIARRLGQISRLGQLLDPIADRLYTVTVLVVMLVRGILPVWFVAILVLRDVILSLLMIALKRRGVTGLPVHFIGKTATFCLLVAFPFLFLGEHSDVALAVAWAMALWGAGLYVWAAVLYLLQGARILRHTPVAG